MFKKIIEPKISDTDAIGHINNVALPAWFEWARNPLFKLFMPEIDFKRWNILLAKLEINFEAQLFFEPPIEIRTFISRIGRSSIDVYQEAWQNGTRCVTGIAVVVHYDIEQKKSMPIPERCRDVLSQHMIGKK